MPARPQLNDLRAAGPRARRRFVALAVLVAAAAGSPACRLDPGGAESGGVAAKAKNLSVDENVEDLRSRLTSFADRYLSRMGELGDKLIKDAESVETRLELQEARYLTSFAVVEMAGGANPAASLLDLMVMTRLQHRVWQRDRFREMLGPEGAEKADRALRELAEDMWRIGRDYLTPMQVDDVERLVGEWVEANPDRERVYSVRFDNFAQLRGGEALKASLQGSGLFGAIDDAANTADTATKLAARAKFVAERMPLLLSWQLEMLAADLVAMPEMQGVLDGIDASVQAVEAATRAVESMPRQVAEQSGELSQLMKETRATIADTRQTVAQVEAATGPAGGMAQQFEDAAAALTTTTETIRGFYDSVSTAPADDASGGGFEVTEYADAAGRIEAAAKEVDAVIASTRSLLGSDAVDSTVTDLTDAADARIDHVDRAGHGLLRAAFWYGLILVAVACIGGIAAAMGYRLLAHRVWGDAPAR